MQNFKEQRFCGGGGVKDLKLKFYRYLLSDVCQVKADAVSSDDSASMSSDDEDFNPDELEAKSAKEEYDSDPSDTGEHTTSAQDPEPQYIGPMDSKAQKYSYLIGKIYKTHSF